DIPYQTTPLSPIFIISAALFPSSDHLSVLSSHPPFDSPILGFQGVIAKLGPSNVPKPGFLSVSITNSRRLMSAFSLFFGFSIRNGCELTFHSWQLLLSLSSRRGWDYLALLFKSRVTQMPKSQSRFHLESSNPPTIFVTKAFLVGCSGSSPNRYLCCITISPVSGRSNIGRLWFMKRVMV
ncbi:hypothetical protein LINGRAHAP2_LOCUS30863, partial [Linum grandiflorum]